MTRFSISNSKDSYGPRSQTVSPAAIAETDILHMSLKTMEEVGAGQPVRISSSQLLLDKLPQIGTSSAITLGPALLGHADGGMID